MTAPALDAGLLGALREAVGAEHVLVEADLTASYETDWTGRFTGRAGCVVRPASTEQVAAVVRACAAAGVPIVVQGGNTGLVGGATPAGGEVLLSLTRLDELGEVDRAGGQVSAGAGVTLADLQKHARSAGLDFGVDLAARDSATVGGLVATNAGGIRVLRYGSMRAQLLGAEAVLADGSVVSRMAGLLKDGTGYDLVSLLCGSEGTLGVVTKVRLRLVPRLASRAVALLAMPDADAAIAVLPGLRERLPHLSAAELLFAPGLALVRKHGHLPAPFGEEHPAFLLVECADRLDPTDALVEAVSEAEGLLDATVATDSAGQRALWAYREQHTEAISAEGVPVKLDVSVPTGRLPELVARLAPTIAAVAPDARPIVFGHVNEGNLHVNVLDAGELAEQVTAAVLHLVAGLEGSISSEHGVGRAKCEYLGLSRSRTEIAAMRAIKDALDPAGLLNPGVLLPAR
ncbi:MAG: linked oxidase domain protein [Frankiales bacterium]|nr:linked oxidase domain protein [Frankiales bacterium]